MVICSAFTAPSCFARLPPEPEPVAKSAGALFSHFSETGSQFDLIFHIVLSTEKERLYLKIEVFAYSISIQYTST